ncbi:hypothetical protein QUF58_01810 [Anaerolineales bacterium HSG24]|nr:hypothetical protein [Anaerolineales bacterium HSG24]
MNNLQQIEQEKSVLQWGGLAGILGGILFIIVFAVVFGFVGEEPVELEEWVMRFPDVRAARTVENGLYLLVFIFWIPHFLALYRALKETRLAPALFGSVLGILGLTVLAAGSLIHVATDPLSDIYHASGATPADQAALALMWQATWGIFDALLFAGLGIVSVGLTLLGVAMFGSPAFGKGFAWFSLIIGVIGIVATVVLLIDPDSPIAILNIFGLIIFHLVIGWKTYSLSRA